LQKKQLTTLRKRIFKNVKAKALSYEVGQSPELKSYYKDQKKFSERVTIESSLSELNASIKKSQVIYLGDFHTFEQNIRSLLRILKFLVKHKSHCKIALEMVSAKHQYYIDAYLNDHLTDIEFLESIKYHQSWRFPWTHYQIIFEFAKKNKIPMLAVNTTGSLLERDHFAAHAIAKEINEGQKKTKLLVLYGELHIVPDKIPALVQEYTTEKIGQTIIHQNLDEVYWKQVEKKTSGNIVKFNNDEFCLNSAPPWIKYESMLYWYENLDDDPDFDIHEYIIETGKKTLGSDAQENFINLCREMLKVTKVEKRLSLSEISQFNLFDHTKLEFIEDEICKLSKKPLINFYNFLIENNHSFKLPISNLIYCSSYSLNRLAYLAGNHIFHTLYQNDINHKQIIMSGSKQDIFQLFFFEAFFSFYFSKLINPHRKCNLYQDFKDFIKTKSDIRYHLIIKIIDHKKDYFTEIKNIKENYFLATQIGHFLAEQFYTKSIKNPKQYSLILLIGKLDSISWKNSFTEIKSYLLNDKKYRLQRKGYF
jgi:hypothetical protein